MCRGKANSSIVENTVFGIMMMCDPENLNSSGPARRSYEHDIAWLKVECDKYYNMSETCKGNRSFINNFKIERRFEQVDIMSFLDSFQKSVVELDKTGYDK